MAITVNPRVKTLQAGVIRLLTGSVAAMGELLEATRDAGVMEKELVTEALREENARLRAENARLRAKPRKGRGGGPATG